MIIIAGIPVRWALSFTQPWATLVATGAKRVETRSWRTKHRGLLAIHAARHFPPQAKAVITHQHFWQAFFAGRTSITARELRETVASLPRGRIIAVVQLVDCVPAEKLEGRWAWILGDVERLPEPIPWRGSLGLWELR